MGRSRRIAFAALLTALLAIGPGAARAHVAEQVGGFEVELGWAEEPPIVGAANAVELEVADAGGVPLAVAAGALSVEVVHGGTSAGLPLVPTAARGHLEAPITPTRPGRYSFRVSGEVGGRPLDVSVACSPSTFECVKAGAGNQFPTTDPTPGELAQRLSSEAQRLEDANERADEARTLAAIALAIGTVGLLAGGAALLASRRRGGERS